MAHSKIPVPIQTTGHRDLPIRKALEGLADGSVIFDHEHDRVRPADGLLPSGFVPPPHRGGITMTDRSFRDHADPSPRETVFGFSSHDLGAGVPQKAQRPVYRATLGDFEQPRTLFGVERSLEMTEVLQISAARARRERRVALELSPLEPAAAVLRLACCFATRLTRSA